MQAEPLQQSRPRARSFKRLPCSRSRLRSQRPTSGFKALSSSDKPPCDFTKEPFFFASTSYKALP